jgi:hypothetical protein
LALLSWLLLAQAATLPARAQPAKSPFEYQVKAAVIYNFTKFIEWPPSASGAAAGSRFEMCLLGDKEVFELLRHTLRGKEVRGSTVEIREIADPSEAAGCQLVFITQARDRSLFEALAAAPGGVLTIAEAPDLDKSGAIINLVLEQARVGFEIDIERANRANLKISSNLLRLARFVSPKGER